MNILDNDMVRKEMTILGDTGEHAHADVRLVKSPFPFAGEDLAVVSRKTSAMRSSKQWLKSIQARISERILRSVVMPPSIVSIPRKDATATNLDDGGYHER